MKEDLFLRYEAVASLRDQAAITLWRHVRDGLFPAPTREGRHVGWRRSTIEAWLREQEANLKDEHRRIRDRLDQLCPALNDC